MDSRDPGVPNKEEEASGQSVWKERDDFIMKLEREQKKLQSAEVESTSTKEEAKLAQDALSRA